jgi:hypothetical protein
LSSWNDSCITKAGGNGSAAKERPRLSKPHAGPKLRCTRLPANQMDQSLNIVIVDESAIRAAMPPPLL